MAIEPAQSISPTADGPKLERLIGKGWAQGVALVMIFGFFVMGILADRTYTASMPMLDKVVSESGRVLFTNDQITRGQEIFQARGLQEYGSIVGHGAYLGPDYTAEYLRLSTDDVAEQLRTAGAADPHDAVVREFRTNRYNPDTGSPGVHRPASDSIDNIARHYAAFFGGELHQVRAAAAADLRSRRIPRPDRILRMDCVGVGRRAPVTADSHTKNSGRRSRGWKRRRWRS